MLSLIITLLINLATTGTPATAPTTTQKSSDNTTITTFGGTGNWEENGIISDGSNE